MIKEYKSNVEYSKIKRRNSVIMSILLLIVSLGMASLFVAFKQWTFVAVFALFAFLPIFAIPSTFKNYPVDHRTLIEINDGVIKVNGEEVNLKQIEKIRASVELPASKIDSENIKRLNELKTSRPEENLIGTFDFVLKSEGKRPKILYTTIEDVAEATYDFVKLGIKDYRFTYNIKKNVVRCEYNFKNYFEPIQKEEGKVSKKDKVRQLI